MGEDVKRLDAMDRYIEQFDVAPLSDEERNRVDAELLGATPATKKRKAALSWQRA